MQQFALFVNQTRRWSTFYRGDQKNVFGKSKKFWGHNIISLQLSLDLSKENSKDVLLFKALVLNDFLMFSNGSYCLIKLDIVCLLLKDRFLKYLSVLDKSISSLLESISSFQGIFRPSSHNWSSQPPNF